MVGDPTAEEEDVKGMGLAGSRTVRDHKNKSYGIIKLYTNNISRFIIKVDLSIKGRGF